MDKPPLISTSKWRAEMDHMAGRLTINGNSESDVIDYLYNRLTIVDGKASSLLTVNSILLAVGALAISQDFANEFPELATNYGSIPLKLAGLSWLLSSTLCLIIGFLGWKHLTLDSNGVVTNLSDYKATIAKVTVHRTLVYNFAVILTLLAIVGLGLLLLF